MTYLTRSSPEFFADDTAIYLAISSEGESVTLQNDIHTLEIREKRWDKSFNPSKCQVLKKAEQTLGFLKRNIKVHNN